MAQTIESGGIGLVGIDMARQSRRPSRTIRLPWIIASIVAALFIVGLRIDLIRMGYARAAALAEEQVLREQERALTVEMRRLHKHSRLVQEASQRGFQQADSIIDLPLPALPSVATAVAALESRP